MSTKTLTEKMKNAVAIDEDDLKNPQQPQQLTKKDLSKREEFMTNSIYKAYSCSACGILKEGYGYVTTKIGENLAIHTSSHIPSRVIFFSEAYQQEIKKLLALLPSGKGLCVPSRYHFTAFQIDLPPFMKKLESDKDECHLLSLNEINDGIYFSSTSRSFISSNMVMVYFSLPDCYRNKLVTIFSSHQVDDKISLDLFIYGCGSSMIPYLGMKLFDSSDMVPLSEFVHHIYDSPPFKELSIAKRDSINDNDVSFGFRGAPSDFDVMNDMSPERTVHVMIMMQSNHLKDSAENPNDKRQIEELKPRFYQHSVLKSIGNDVLKSIENSLLKIKIPSVALLSFLPFYDNRESHLIDSLIHRSFEIIDSNDKKNFDNAIKLNNLNSPNFLFNYGVHRCDNQNYFIFDHIGRLLSTTKINNIAIRPIFLQILISLLYATQKLSFNYKKLSLDEIRVMSYRNGLNLAYLLNNQIYKLTTQHLIKLPFTEDCEFNGQNVVGVMKIVHSLLNQLKGKTDPQGDALIDRLLLINDHETMIKNLLPIDEGESHRIFILN